MVEDPLWRNVTGAVFWAGAILLLASLVELLVLRPVRRRRTRSLTDDVDARSSVVVTPR